MKGENRIFAFLAEMVNGQDRLTAEVSEIKNESIKHNFQIAENSQAVLKVADETGLLLNTKRALANLNSQFSNDD